MYDRVRAPIPTKGAPPRRATRVGSPPASRYASALALQRALGNQQLSRLLAAQVAPAGQAARLILQRDVESAAQALFSDGHRNVRKSQLKGKFAKTHGVSASDLNAIQDRINELREEHGPTTTHELVDLTQPENWPTNGGMTEDEARAVAEHYEWETVNKRFRCKDPSHAPKGTVYTNGDVYYGADNTGHVGWGFKIWSSAGGVWLKYNGNMTWDGSDWIVNSRGTS